MLILFTMITSIFFRHSDNKISAPNTEFYLFHIPYQIQTWAKIEKLKEKL